MNSIEFLFLMFELHRSHFAFENQIVTFRQKELSEC